MTTPDDRFRPDDDQPDDYAVGDEYQAAPAPGTAAPVTAAPYLTAPADPMAAAPDYAAPGVDAGAAPNSAPAGAPANLQQSPYMQHGPYLQPPMGATNVWAQRLGFQGPAYPISRPQNSKTWLAVILLLPMVLIVAGVGFFSLLIGFSGGGNTPTGTDPPYTTTPDLPSTWVVTAADLHPDADGLAVGYSIDGTFGGRNGFIEVGDMLVVAAMNDSGEIYYIGGLDGATGEVQWSRELRRGLCAVQPIDTTLMCMAPQGDFWSIYAIDATTGEDQWVVPTTVEDVQLLHAGPAGLFAVSPANPAPHALVSGFDLTGQPTWSFDLADFPESMLLFDNFLGSNFSGVVGTDEADVDGDGDTAEAEFTMERPRWRELDGGLVALWVVSGVAIIDPATGDATVHECMRIVTAGDHYFCMDDTGINRRDLTSAVVWSAPGYIMPLGGDNVVERPVAMTESFETVPFDWEAGVPTGEPGFQMVPRSGGFVSTVLPPLVSGTPETTVLTGNNTMVVLEPDSDRVAWSLTGDDYTFFEPAIVTDGVIVMPDYTTYGLDPATGDQLWTGHPEYGYEFFDYRGGMLGTQSEAIAFIEFPN